MTNSQRQNLRNEDGRANRPRQHEQPSAWLKARAMEKVAGRVINKQVKPTPLIYRVAEGTGNPHRGPEKLLRDYYEGGATMEQAIEDVMGVYIEYARRLWNGEER